MQSNRRLTIDTDLSRLKPKPTYSELHNMLWRHKIQQHIEAGETVRHKQLDRQCHRAALYLLKCVNDPEMMCGAVNIVRNNERIERGSKWILRAVIASVVIVGLLGVLL